MKLFLILHAVKIECSMYALILNSSFCSTMFHLSLIPIFEQPIDKLYNIPLLRHIESYPEHASITYLT